MHAEAIRRSRSRKCTTEFYLRHFVITRSQDTQEIKASTDKLPKKGGQFLLIKREREGERGKEREEEGDSGSRKKSRKVSSETKLRVLNSP